MFKQRNYEAALKETFHRMDEMILAPQGQKELLQIAEREKSRENSEMTNNISSLTGCTSVVVLVTKDVIYCANAGDSRSVLAKKGQNDTVVSDALSEDHKPDNDEENKRIYAAGGYVEDSRVNGSLALSRAIGDFEYKSNTTKNYKEQMVTCLPEIKKKMRSKDDEFIVLACDGIWDCLNNDQCINMLNDFMKERKDRNKNLAQMSQCIELMFDKIIATDLMQSGGVGTDNMTTVIVEFKK